MVRRRVLLSSALIFALDCGMAPKPKPKEKKAQRCWFVEADKETREANPEHYWFHALRRPASVLLE